MPPTIPADVDDAARRLVDALEAIPDRDERTLVAVRLFGWMFYRG